MMEGIPPISWFFLFAFAFNGLLTIAILIFKNKSLRAANLMLAINLVGISLATFHVSLVESRLILDFPHFYRLPSPVGYFMFPAAYLYVKLVLNDHTRLQRKEFLHFLPGVIHFFEMAPFYFACSREEKTTYITQVLDEPIKMFATTEGWLPPYLHYLIRGVMAVLYGIAMWRLIRKSKWMDQSKNHYTKNIVQWLKTFAALNTLTGFSIIFFLTLVFIPADIRSLCLHIVVLLVVLIPNAYLFVRPEILYGLPQPVFIEVDQLVNRKSAPEDVPIPAEIPPFIYLYKEKVHQYLMESRRYLEPDFMLADLSRDTGIPKHHLQLLIHKAEGKTFSEFINVYRIRYMKDQVGKGVMQFKTLEGLAAECGFGSRATFNRTIKKQTGQTPKEYFVSHDTASKQS